MQIKPGYSKRRMLPIFPQDQSQVHYASPVQLQFFNGCPAGWRQAEHLRKIFTPFKMLLPRIYSRIVKRRKLAGYRVCPMRENVFLVVAQLAGISKVQQDSQPAQAKWKDVLGGKDIGTISFLGKAIFAAAFGSLPNHFFETAPADVSHVPPVLYPIQPSKQATKCGANLPVG